MAVELLVAAHEPLSDDPGDHSTLPLDVLVRLGVRGNRGAQDALGRYLASGVDVPHLLFVLQGDGERTSRIPAWRSALERLAPVLCERFPSREKLRCAFEEMRESFWIACESPPWSLWAARDPTIGDVLREYDEGTGGTKDRLRVPDLGSLTTTELLTVEDRRLDMKVFAV